MSELEVVRSRIKNKKYDTKRTTNNTTEVNKYVNNLITRLLVSVIVFFGVLIITNLNSEANAFIKKDILKNNMSFTKISNIYNKYFGKVIPIKDASTNTKTVFNEKLKYNEMKDYKDGYLLNVEDNYLVPIINSGIVVFIGEKEGYGNTIIIQGIDEVDYWYGNMDNISVSLYDYVNKGAPLGNASGDSIYLVFEKNGEYLGYDEIME